MDNPINGQRMKRRNAKRVEALREARRGARKWARSGNPARRAEGRKGLIDIPNAIRQLYINDYKGVDF